MTSTRFALSALLLAGSVILSPAQAKRGLAIGDFFAMKRIADPALSPDGKWVAYNVTTADRGANKNITALRMSPLDGGPERELTNNPSFNGNAAWSPDGKWIAFESSRSGAEQIWLLATEGGDPQQFTTLSTGASQAVWSPDGKSIAFVSEVFPGFSSLPFRESDALNRKKLDERENGKVKARLITHLMYRHWNRWVEGKRAHIFVQPVGGEPLDVTPGDRDAVPTSATFSGGLDFCFSPDGREIAYTATPLPSQGEAWSTNHDIYTVPSNGGVPKQITTNPAADGFPRYSPDGRYIAYRAQRRSGFEADRWELMLYERGTGAVRSLTQNFDLHVGPFLWAPDGGMLYFEAEEKGAVPVFRVSITGNDVQKVFEGHSNHDIRITADGKFLVFTHVSAVRPAEIYRCRTDGTGATAVTGINDAVFAGLDVPSPTSITYDGEGGTKIQAWIYTPPGFSKSRRYPLVFMVHGGPQGAWLDGWSYRWNPPLWAARGYVVMAPNPRGSTGFGQQFTDEISRDWGGKVYTDLLKGMDYAAGLPYIDGNRMAAAGASFGGYMMNWFLGNAGSRFRAIVSHDGSYNFESNYGTTDELWFDEWEHGGTPWQKPDEFTASSPHRFAKNFRTPTLVIHGALDFRVPESEGMQLFTALQRQGVPSEFLYFPDEGHWVLKPANSELWHTTVFDWLARYLKE
jgi:dipeptidyl aminopeptidase/acylaminoacyl peptidase